MTLDSGIVLRVGRGVAGGKLRRLTSLPACFALSCLLSTSLATVALLRSGPVAVAVAVTAQLALGLLLHRSLVRARRRIREVVERLRTADIEETVESGTGDLAALGSLGAALRELIDALVDTTRDLEQNGLEIVRTIALATEARDPHTQGHCLRVQHLTRRLVDELSTIPEFLEEMSRVPGFRRKAETAALLHDVGKIAVPDALLLKAGKLSAGEYARVQEHARDGAEILQSLSSMREVSEYVRHHHERFDGAGYPDRLAGQEIPLASRIIAVADTIDAMRATRPYRPALDRDTMLVELGRTRGTQLDPRIVDVALGILRRSGGRSRRQAVLEPEPRPLEDTVVLAQVSS